MSSAEPLDADVIRRFLAAGRRFGMAPDVFAPAYGLAEATLAVTLHPSGGPFEADVVDAALLESTGTALPSDGERELVRLGRPLAGVEVRIVDDTGTDLGDRRVGEVKVRGPSVASFQFDMAGNRSPVCDGDGWLATGDLGYTTESGEIVVCGRKKDMIIVSGRNICPTDLERAAEFIPGVRRDSVVAVSLRAGHAEEAVAIVVESHSWRDVFSVRRIRGTIGLEVYRRFGIAPAMILVVEPGMVRKTASGKLQRGLVKVLLPT